MIHLPIRFKKYNITYDLIKIYENFGLYENREIGVKECFTPHQLGTLEEEIKPDKEARKGGACKID